MHNGSHWWPKFNATTRKSHSWHTTIQNLLTLLTNDEEQTAEAEEYEQEVVDEEEGEEEQVREQWLQMKSLQLWQITSLLMEWQ